MYSRIKPPTEPDPILSLKEQYLEGGLQIIVMLANIQLRPENPSYEGGSWLDHREREYIILASENDEIGA